MYQVIRKAQMFKKGHMRRTWKMRWFVLFSTDLIYYKTKESLIKKVRIHNYVVCMYVCIYACTYIYVRVYVHMYVLCVYMYVCMYVCTVCVCMYVYMYVYIHVRMYEDEVVCSHQY